MWSPPEPAVHVLNKQVEELSGGAISRRTMMAGLSIGMSLSLGFAMTRVLTGIHIFWFLLPGYLLALALTFFVPACSPPWRSTRAVWLPGR